MTDKEALTRQIEVLKEQIATNRRLRDEGKPFSGVLRYAYGPSAMGTSTLKAHWDELIDMQVKTLSEAEERLASLCSK